MTEMLQSIKADLFSRRLLPLVGLLGLALVVATAYALVGGSGAGSPSPASSPGASGGAGPRALTVAVAAPNTHEAVAETPVGKHYQNQGPTRDPFIALPSPPAAKSASTISSSSASSKSSKSSKSSGSSTTGGSSAGGGPSSGGGAGSGAQKAPVPAPKKPAKPELPYDVSVLFGPASTTPGQPAMLAPYEKLKLQQPFPSKQNVRFSFERVTASGNGAVFKLVAPPILHGSGICLPSNAECQTIDLEAGHSEELEYVEADGQIAVYELKVVSIAKKAASAARVKLDAKTAHAARRAAPAQAIGGASSLQGWGGARVSGASLR